MYKLPFHLKLKNLVDDLKTKNVIINTYINFSFKLLSIYIIKSYEACTVSLGGLKMPRKV